jgi:AcrR family transcriptional regulator
MHASVDSVGERGIQAVRSARTREAVLDATIKCLIEFGYNGLTTRRVAVAAGITRGAQQHHFAGGKTQMVGEAVVHLARRLSEELVERLTSSPPEQQTTEAALDAFWELHRSPLLEAGLELWVAARTDPELRATLEDVERSITTTAAAATLPLFGERALAPGFAADMDDVLAAMRGLALRALGSSADARIERRWRHMRPWLAARLDGGSA